MKKFLTIAAVAAIAVGVQAATVGWSIGKTDAAYKGNAYQLFVIGQNGVESVDAIKLLLDSGTDVSGKAFGEGVLTSNAGGVNVKPGDSGKTLAGADPAITYTSFFVVYDAATPVAGSSKYIVLGNFSADVADTTASFAFQAKDQSSVATNPSNWASFGSDPVPEPTTVALLTLGLAAVGLKRKVA